MASIRKRGDTFTITAYMGYDDTGKQLKKTTTFRPPDNVTASKAEKLAREFAVKWEDKIRGFVALDENRTLSELAQWYYETIAPNTLKPNRIMHLLLPPVPFLWHCCSRKGCLVQVSHHR